MCVAIFAIWYDWHFSLELKFGADKCAITMILANQNLFARQIAGCSQIDIQPILFALLLYSPVSFSLSLSIFDCLFVEPIKCPINSANPSTTYTRFREKCFFFLFIFLLLVMNLFGWKYVDLNILTLIKSTKQINKFNSN